MAQKTTLLLVFPKGREHEQSDFKMICSRLRSKKGTKPGVSANSKLVDLVARFNKRHAAKLKRKKK